MESLCTVGSDDRLCTVRVGILSLNTPTHQGAQEPVCHRRFTFSFFSLFYFFFTCASLSCIGAAGEGECLCVHVDM